MERPAVPPVIRHLGLKVGVLLTLSVVLIAGFAAYVLYARGVFEATHKLTLVADNVEGVSVGMDLTFAGFPIGRVRRIALADDGRARIEVEIAQRDRRWLRTTSVFTLERSLVGATRLRAFSGDLADPPLPEGAVREVLRGDVAEDIPRMVATLRAALEHVERITAAGSSLNASLANLRALTQRMTGRYGAAEGLLGSEAHAQKLLDAVDRVNALLGELSGVARRTDRLIANADRRVLGPGGVVDDLQQAIGRAKSLLGEAGERLRAVDAILENAQGASADARTVTRNAAAASADLAALRAEVEQSVRRIGHLIEEIDRKWPFERDPALRLP